MDFSVFERFSWRVSGRAGFDRKSRCSERNTGILRSAQNDDLALPGPQNYAHCRSELRSLSFRLRLREEETLGVGDGVGSGWEELAGLGVAGEGGYVVGGLIGDE